MSNVSHNVSHADHRHVLAHLEGTIAESREPIEMVDHILGVEHALGGIPFHADRFGALSPDGKDDGARAKGTNVLYCEVFPLADRDIAEVMDIGLLEQLPVLLLKSAAQFELGRKDAILGQSAELNVPIENDHLMAGLCQRAGGCHTCWPRADHNNHMG